MEHNESGYAMQCPTNDDKFDGTDAVQILQVGHWNTISLALTDFSSAVPTRKPITVPTLVPLSVLCFLSSLCVDQWLHANTKQAQQGRVKQYSARMITRERLLF